MSYAEPSKREELFDPSGRYILLRRLGHEGETVEAEVDPGVDMPGGLPSKGKRRAQGPEVNFDPDELVGYVSFRFDTEETLGSKDAEVVYWSVHRSADLGKGTRAETRGQLRATARFGRAEDGLRQGAHG